MGQSCRACNSPRLETSRFPSLCGPCGERSLQWNRMQPSHVPNDWPKKVHMEWADWDWDTPCMTEGRFTYDDY